MGSPPVDGVVLVVDDVEANARLLKRMLSDDGYEVLVANGGEAALAIVAERQPDLLLLDAVMPDIDGFEVCRRIKADRATRLIPVVIVTGLHDADAKVRGIDVGADDFITKPFVTAELRARVRSLLRLKRYTDELETAESVIVSLAQTIEARDPYTEGHCRRLAAYAQAMGRFLELPEDDLAVLGKGGLIHDIGKIAVPDAILLKDSPLTPEEFDRIKQHTIVGDALCSGLKSLRRVRAIVRHHHERADGSGYPDGLAGDAIPLLAEIVSIVDVYDALTTDRSYRRAMMPTDACQALRAEAARGWRRPQLVDALVALSGSGVLDATASLAAAAGPPSQVN